MPLLKDFFLFRQNRGQRRQVFFRLGVYTLPVLERSFLRRGKHFLQFLDLFVFAVRKSFKWLNPGLFLHWRGFLNYFMFVDINMVLQLKFRRSSSLGLILIQHLFCNWIVTQNECSFSMFFVRTKYLCSTRTTPPCRLNTLLMHLFPIWMGYRLVTYLLSLDQEVRCLTLNFGSYALLSTYWDFRHWGQINFGTSHWKLLLRCYRMLTFNRW